MCAFQPQSTSTTKHGSVQPHIYLGESYERQAHDLHAYTLLSLESWGSLLGNLRLTHNNSVWV